MPTHLAPLVEPADELTIDQHAVLRYNGAEFLPIEVNQIHQTDPQRAPDRRPQIKISISGDIQEFPAGVDPDRTRGVPEDRIRRAELPVLLARLHGLGGLPEGGEFTDRLVAKFDLPVAGWRGRSGRPAR